MSITNKKGDIGEAAFFFKATEKGYWAAKMPQDCPYDFVLDRGQGLERIQVKYRSAKKNGSIQVNSYNESNSSFRSYKDVVDQFAVYVAETKEVYLIPADKVTKNVASIFRLSPTKNNQSKGVTLITEFIEW
jgi:hypothetical protein